MFKLMAERHCKRQFLPQPVPKSILARVLEAAAQAPSSKNTQPWQVSVLLGSAVADLSQLLCQAFDAGLPQQADYLYQTQPWPPEFLERARACGYGLFDLKGIKRHDKQARKAHDRENFTFFGAPAYFIFHLPLDSARGSFLDLGFFMQNVMLGLVSQGLASCPQFSVVAYPDLIREFLGLTGERSRWMISGMAVGYPDPEAQVNSYIPERLPLEKYVSWYE